MSDIPINQLPRDVQDYIRDYSLDTSPSGAPDGVINAADMIAIADRVSVEADPDKRKLVASIGQAVLDPLQAPRGAAVAARIGNTLDTTKTPVTWEGVSKLSDEDLRGANVSERLAMIKAITAGRGYMWPGIRGVFDATQQAKVVDILNATPEYQLPALRGGLAHFCLQTDDEQFAFTDPAQKIRLQEFLLNSQWAEHDAQRVSWAFSHLKNDEEAQDYIEKIRTKHGPDFTGQVLAWVISSHSDKPLGWVTEYRRLHPDIAVPSGAPPQGEACEMPPLPSYGVRRRRLPLRTHYIRQY